MGFCNCSMFCCALPCVHYSFAIISMGKRELVALLCLSSWCLVIVVWVFLMIPRVCLQFVILVFPDHTHLLFGLFKLFFFIFKEIFFLVASTVTLLFHSCGTDCTDTFVVHMQNSCPFMSWAKIMVL